MPATAFLSFPLAHMTVPGMNAFSSGLLHPWMTPTHVMILLALGLWLGQQVPLRLGLACKVFAPAAAAALGLSATKWVTTVPPFVLVAIALVISAAVALEARLPSPARVLLLAAAAIGIGLDSGPETPLPFDTFSTLAGTWVSLGLGLVNIAYYVSLATALQKKWISIGIRVLGSWIFAISLLMLAFALRPHP
ncbi:MAG TPA: HupE/UreJ family protein [Chthoniobacter sp.]|nr:HupE/UreJ family protein [Chthoniobacter sp.]